MLRQKTLPGFATMLSSPSATEQFCTRKFVPATSMPSVLGDVPGALMVTPKSVTLLLAPLNARWKFGEFRNVTPV